MQAQPTVGAMPEVAGWPVVRFFIALGLVVLAGYGLWRFIRRNRGAAAPGNPFLRRAASLDLGQGAALHLVTLGERAYLVGSGERGVGAITAIDDKELADRLNLYAGETGPAPGPQDFASLLTGLTGRGRDFLRSQRDRLRPGGGVR
jgi:flagellar protein FliO/FliZ